MRSLLLLTLAAALAAGCDESVEPTLVTDRAFTLYGTIDPTSDRQTLRVVPITDRIDAPTDAPLGAEITSVESGTGRAVVWRDSLVTFPNGERGVVAVAEGYTPRPGSTVTVTVRGADGRAAEVAVAVPALAQPQVVGSGATVAVRVPGLPATQLASAGLRVRVTGLAGADTTTLALPAGYQRTDGGYTIPFADLAQTVLQNAGAVGRARLVDVVVRTFVTGPGWSIPEGGYDPEVIVEPGVLTNVTGGFGFVGGGYVVETPWTPSLVAQSTAGFLVDASPASFLRINEVRPGTSGAWVELYNPTPDGISLSGSRLASGTAGGPVLDLPPFFRVEPGQYVAFDVPFAVETGRTVELQTAAGARVLEFKVVDTPPGGTAGLFPDGRSQPIAVRGFRPDDAFAAPLAPTRGGPNQLAFAPVAINEVFTAGLDGFVEVVATDTLRFEVLLVGVASGPEGAVVRGEPARPTGPGRYVAEEVRNADPNAALRLTQTGGEVVAFVIARDLATGFTARFPAAVRAFGVQAPDRSEGFLPDGPGGTWTPGLAPTRGVPNGTAGRIARR